MNYWLIKSEPNGHSWDDLVKLGRDHWDGFRNYKARNNLKAMMPGDLAFFYHRVNEEQIVGIAECVSEHYPDPTIDDDRWVVVDFVPKEKLDKLFTLEDIKKDDRLSEMVLVKNTRRSVQLVIRDEFEIILKMAGV